jgi:hypothetical protein
VSSGDHVGDRNLFFVRHHLFRGDLQIRESLTQMGEKRDEPLGTRSLIRRRIVLQDIGGKNLTQHLQFALVDRFGHLLLCFDIRLFADASSTCTGMQKSDGSGFSLVADGQPMPAYDRTAVPASTLRWNAAVRISH